jgi:hypothetical protein
LGLATVAVTCVATAHDVETNYRLYCMGCHVEDGSGLEGKVPSMRGTLVPLSMQPDGRRFLVQVPGVAQSPLSNAEIALLLNWMIANLAEKKSADVAAFTEQEVARYRANRLLNVRATRAELTTRLTPLPPATTSDTPPDRASPAK